MKLKGRDWLGAAATLFALAVTFNAEYEIAIAVHIHPLVAYAVPGALDVYVLRALQVKRDVFLTVLAMVAVNAASHLVTADVLAVSPALIVAVSAIAPLVLWRAHVLRHAGTGTVNVPDAPPVPEHQPNVTSLQEHADQAIGNVTGDDREQIERSWYGEHDVPELPSGWNGHIVDVPGHTATVLHVVADTDPGVLLDGDKAFLDQAREMSVNGNVPTFRALKSELGMGTDRARRIRQYLELERAGTS